MLLPTDLKVKAQVLSQSMHLERRRQLRRRHATGTPQSFQSVQTDTSLAHGKWITQCSRRAGEGLRTSRRAQVKQKAAARSQRLDHTRSAMVTPQLSHSSL